MSYTGSVELISGITPKNGQGFPLVNAPDVYIDDTHRLPDALSDIHDDIDDKISDLKSDLNNAIIPYNAVDILLLNITPKNGTVNGINYTFNGKYCEASGTSTGASFSNIYVNKTKLPIGLHSGETYSFLVESTDNNLTLQLFFYDLNGTQIGTGRYLSSDAAITIPENATGAIFRVGVPANTTVNARIDYSVLSGPSNQEIKTNEENLSNALTSLENDLNNAIIPYNAVDILLLNGTPNNETVNGINYTINGKYCEASGTSTGLSFSNIYSNKTKLPIGLHSGETYSFLVESTDNNLTLQLFFYDLNGTQIGTGRYLSSDAAITIPENATGAIFRVGVPANTTVNARIDYSVLSGPSNQEIKTNEENLSNALTSLENDLNNAIIPYNAVDILLLNGTPNNETVNGINYTFNGNICTAVGTTTSNNSIKNIYANKAKLPDGITAGNTYNICITTSDTHIFLALFFYDLNRTQIGTGRYLHSDTAITIPENAVGAIIRVEVAANTTVNGTIKYSILSGVSNKEIEERLEVIEEKIDVEPITYNFLEYHNTYNQSVSPTITTDTNAYLASTGDTTDRTADIVALLQSSGICRLGKGIYYVNNLEMPDYTSIIGTGYGTQIILTGTDTDSGFAIKMNDCCLVSDLRISGTTNNISQSETVQNRHGILWQGNFTEDQTAGNQPQRSIVSNVWLDNFTGGGITCYDTGYGTFNALEVTNVYCRNCNAGINISYWSEFHKFTNVRTAGCYYGCINNGGNNVFVNCDFSTCKVAFLMDNSVGQSPNNSHGSAIGCVFNHTDGNNGIGIKVLNCDAGFIFDGCQIFYSQLYFDDCDGIVVSNTNFGNLNCNITVKSGGAVLFVNNMHGSVPTITITDNDKVHFSNCYVRSSGQVVSP